MKSGNSSEDEEEYEDEEELEDEEENNQDDTKLFDMAIDLLREDVRKLKVENQEALLEKFKTVNLKYRQAMTRA